MNRWIHWIFLRWREPPGRCRRCDVVLTTCRACGGRWRARACPCGLGSLCPRHHEHWF